MQLLPARGPPRLTALQHFSRSAFQLVSMLTYFKEENMTENVADAIREDRPPAGEMFVLAGE